MNKKILRHYSEFSTYTYPGLYQDKLKGDLPDEIREIGLLIRKNFIHRTTLAAGNVGTNADLKFGDMTKVPWWRQPEDDILVTAAAMLAARRNWRRFRYSALSVTSDSGISAPRLISMSAPPRRLCSHPIIRPGPPAGCIVSGR